MAADVEQDGTASETLDAQVKGRVPAAYVTALDELVTEARKRFPRYSRSDAVREALTHHFKRHKVSFDGSSNGKAAA